MSGLPQGVVGAFIGLIAGLAISYVSQKTGNA